MNKIFLIGRLTHTPEIKFVSNDIAVCKFTIAVNGKKDQETDFIDITAWRKLAENCASYLEKGKLVAVEGSLHIRTYKDKDGNNRKAAEVTADNVQFLSPKGGQDSAPIVKEDSDSTDEDLPF